MRSSSLHPSPSHKDIESIICLDQPLMLELVEFCAWLCLVVISVGVYWPAVGYSHVLYGVAGTFSKLSMLQGFCQHQGRLSNTCECLMIFFGPSHKLSP